MFQQTSPQCQLIRYRNRGNPDQQFYKCIKPQRLNLESITIPALPVRSAMTESQTRHEHGKDDGNQRSRNSKLRHGQP